MQAIILAAGKGRRLRPLTNSRPKAMAPILDRPIIWRVMETLYNACQATSNIRIDEIIIVMSPDRQVYPYIVDNWQHTPIKLLIQEHPDGAANALEQARPYIDDNFILSACDNLVPEADLTALLEQFSEPNVVGALSLMEVPQARISSTGIVALENGCIKQIIEKPTPEEAPSNIASLPLYVFTRDLLRYLGQIGSSARGEYELQDAIQLLIDDVAGTEEYVTGTFMNERRQLTDMDDLLALNRYYLEQGVKESRVAPAKIGLNTQLTTPIAIDPDVKIGRNCQIGPNVYIEAGCKIGDGVIIRDAVILRDTVIEAETTVVGCVTGAEISP